MSHNSNSFWEKKDKHDHRFHEDTDLEGHVFMIEYAFSRLDSYCRKANYKGWDLFDGLNSRLFRKSFLYKSEVFRLAWIQLFKRLPINFRCLTLVPKGYNAKGLGLFASGFVALQRTEEAKTLLDTLKRMKCDGFEGISWGYNISHGRPAHSMCRLARQIW